MIIFFEKRKTQNSFNHKQLKIIQCLKLGYKPTAITIF